MAYYKIVGISELPPAVVTAMRAWTYVIIRDIDSVPLCLVESQQGARHVEMLMNDKPLGAAKIT